MLAVTKQWNLRKTVQDYVSEIRFTTGVSPNVGISGDFENNNRTSSRLVLRQNNKYVNEERFVIPAQAGTAGT
ncbi:MAG: hypothetical protein JNM43_19865 [Planctomycetaceae bacterium]|nr:hypothetical protein [Planctomycetaceae bacterium]